MKINNVKRWTEIQTRTREIMVPKEETYTVEVNREVANIDISLSDLKRIAKYGNYGSRDYIYADDRPIFRRLWEDWEDWENS